MRKIIGLIMSVCIVMAAVPGVYASGITVSDDLPPLPENYCTHYVIYTEESRGGRVELSMFNIGESDYYNSDLLIWNNGIIKVVYEELYENDTKYYLDNGEWVEFESGHSRISDNAGTLLYSDLSYLYIGSKPDDGKTYWETEPVDDGYYVRTYDMQQENSEINFYYTSDFSKYDYITSFHTKEKIGNFYYSPSLTYLARLNAKYVVIANLSSHTPEAYKSVGGVYRGTEIYYIDDYNSPIYSAYGSNTTYDWATGQFTLEKESVVADGISGARGVPASTEITYRKTTDFETFVDFEEVYLPNTNEDTTSILLENNRYSLISLKQPNMRKDENGVYHKDYIYGGLGTTLYKNYIRFFDGSEYVYASDKNGPLKSTVSVSNNILYALSSDNGLMYSGNGVYFVKLPVDDEEFDISAVRVDGSFICATGQNAFYKTPIINDEEPVFVALDGYILGFNQTPVREDDRILVPMRFLLERMGAEVNWIEDTKTVVASLEGVSVSMQIDNPKISVSAQTSDNHTVMSEVTTDVPARLVDGITMLPIRFLSETFNFSVTWDEEKNLVTVTK